jgi:hypothetical protein
MSNSKYSRKERLSRSVASVITFVTLGVIKPADHPAPSTSNGPTIAQPATPGSRSNTASAPPEAPLKPTRSKPDSAQASPSKDQRPRHHEQAPSPPANRGVVGPAHNQQPAHNTDPSHRRDHPEPSLFNPAQEMVHKGEGIDDIGRQQLRDRDGHRPLPEPTPTTGLVGGSRPQHQGPQAQGQYSDSQHRGPQNQHPQHQGPQGQWRYSDSQNRGPEHGGPQHQGPQGQRRYSDSQNRGPQNRGPQNQHPGHQQPPKGPDRDGNGQPPGRPPSK